MTSKLQSFLETGDSYNIPLACTSAEKANYLELYLTLVNMFIVHTLGDIFIYSWVNVFFFFINLLLCVHLNIIHCI